MPSFAGVNHVALTVTDLECSTRFYADVLGLLPVLDLGHGRVLLDRRSGFSVGLLRHPGAEGGAFTELRTGLDHLGLTATDRDELVAWEHHLDSLGVDHSPITDTALGSHLNLRDPDGNGLELYRDRPREEWPVNDDGSLGMYTAPLDVRALLAEAD